MYLIMASGFMMKGLTFDVRGGGPQKRLAKLKNNLLNEQEEVMRSFD